MSFSGMAVELPAAFKVRGASEGNSPIYDEHVFIRPMRTVNVYTADRYTRAEERASIARSLWSKIKITTTYSEGSGGTSVAGAVKLTDNASLHITFIASLLTILPEASFTSTQSSLLPDFVGVQV